MQTIIKEIKELRVSLNNDIDLLFNEVKNKLKKYTDNNKDVSIESLATNNILANEVLDMLSEIKKRKVIDTNDTFEIIDLLIQLPIFPEIRSKIINFKSDLQSQSKEKIVIAEQNNHEYKLKNSKVKNDYKKLFFLILSLLFITLLIALIVIYLNKSNNKNVYYLDLDEDGYGSNTRQNISHNTSYKYVENSDDPDDKNPCIPDSSKCSKPKMTSPQETKPPQPDASPQVIIKQPNSTNVIVDSSVRTEENIYYMDQDDDGLGDKNLSIKAKSLPQGYVTNYKDSCPGRKGDSQNSDGCPEIKIEGNQSLYIGDDVTLNIKFNDIKKSDQIKWNSSKDVNFDLKSGSTVRINADVVGKYRVEAVVNNLQDNFNSKAEVGLQVKIQDQHLAKELMNLAEYGNFLLLDIGDLRSKKEKSLQKIETYIQNEDIIVNKQSKNGGKISTTYKAYIDELMSAKRSSDTYINAIKISQIQYHQTNGKIISFNYENN